MKKLPNLDELRCIAASLVLMYHIDAGLVRNHYKEEYYSIFPFNFGSLGVVLFFVLSGFLITWLLLHEKQTTGISVKRFYLKRILRIWPLYYLIIILCFLFLNDWAFLEWKTIAPIQTIIIDKGLLIFLLVIICPNVALLFASSLGYANPTWSIGVEEQFYLIWPHIMKTRRPMIYISSIIIIMIFLRNGLLIHTANWLVQASWLAKSSIVYKSLFTFNRFFVFSFAFKIDAMAIGALGAITAVYYKKILALIFSKTFQWAFYCLFAIAIFTMPDILPYQGFSIFFILLILNLALNEKSLLSIRNRRIAWLGQISYGIYLFHSITIVPSVKLVLYIADGKVNLFTEIMMCAVSLSITVGIATLSYKYFETPFLKMKERLAA